MQEKIHTGLKQQRTVKRPVSRSGIGLHTGAQTTITFHPAPINYGYRFVRTDLENCPEIPADIDHVIDISRGTTISQNGAPVHTVEHVLAALVGMEVDNVRIEVTGKEPPVGDGSAMMFVEMVQEAGVEEQDSPREYLVIEEPILYSDESRGVEIAALPTDDFRVTVMVDYKNPALGSQHSGLFSLEKEFFSEFAPARTFCFLHEVEMLYNNGLIQGGSLDNALVIVDHELNDAELTKLASMLHINEKIILGENGILMNKELRFKNEPARHKLLDLIGDLALVGTPLKAQILAARPGHQSNIEFVKKIRQLYKTKKIISKFQDISKKGVVFDINAIHKILPHRYPFLLVDKVIEFVPGQKIVAIKSVTNTEPFFQGHFPGRPVMPGVLIVEAMAQVGGIMTLNEQLDPSQKLMFFTAMDNVRFRKPVVPGDQIVFEVQLLRQRSTTVKISGKAYVDGDLVCEAELMASVVDRQ